MPTCTAMIDNLNHVYYSGLVNDMLLSLHLFPCTKHNTFSDYNFYHTTINKYYVVIVHHALNKLT